MIVVADTRIPLRDGNVLAADIARESELRRPVVLIRTPYGRAATRTVDDVIGLVRSGWAVVICDVRGRGGSSGEFAPFHQEIHDGKDCVDWVAGQPWCDGRVVMIGNSYRGATQWLAAAARPAALSAIAPTMSTANFGDGWCSENGIPTAGFLRAWALRFAASAPGSSSQARNRALELGDALADDRNSEVDDAEVGVLFPPFSRWMSPPDDAYFGPLDVLRSGAVPVPAHQVAGWYDMFCEGGLAAFATMSHELDPERFPQYLRVGPWAHNGPGSVMVGDTHFGAAADGDRLGMTTDRMDWLRECLDVEGRRHLGHRISVYVLGEGCWREFNSWPPASNAERLPFTADGRLLRPGEAIGTGGSRTLSHDPSDPVRTVGGRGHGHWPLPGPRSGRSTDPDSRTVSYLSDPFRRPLTVIGSMKVDLALQSSADTSDLVIRIAQVAGDGSERLITEQGCRIAARQRIRRLMPAGSTAWRLAEGDRIRLSLSGSSAPRLKVHPDAQTITVEHPVSNPCALVLPVV